jgi:hypothetical protein
MNRAIGLPRGLIVLGIVLPAALLLGVLLATPLDPRAVASLGLVVGILCVPLLMQWHHPMLIITWNASVLAPFLPGQPRLWVVVAAGSLLFSILARAMRREHEFLSVPSVALPLILLGAVVLVTAKFTGGIGGQSLGHEQWGAKRYLGVLGAVIGYFALVARPIPPEQARRFAALFFFTGVTAVVCDLAYLAGPRFYFLYSFFPAELAYNQVASQDTLLRFTGFAWASQAVCWGLIALYGLRGLMDLSKPWRFLLFLGCFGVGLTGGFRSTIILMLIICLTQFYYEGLFRTRYLAIFLTMGILLGTFTAAFVDHMPLAVQRSLSFLPLNVDRAARLDAEGTLDWRVTIWKAVVPEIPRYLLLGKGYAYSGTDYSLTAEAIRRGIYPTYEEALVNGNYHSGILTLIIPFGIGGTLMFAIFCWAALRVLYRNYRHSPDHLKLINTFFLSYFVARLLFYLGFYGQFDLDLMIFTGIVGLSVALNGGVRGPTEAPAVAALEPIDRPPEFSPAPARSFL